MHVKGFDVNMKTNYRKAFTNLGDGTIDWLEVRRAFSDIKYSGFINAELGKGNEAYLLDVSKRMDKIISGQKIKEGTFYSAENQIDCNDLKPGTYILTLVFTHEAVKFIKK